MVISAFSAVFIAETNLDSEMDGDGPLEATESGSSSGSDEEFEEYDPVNDRMGHVVAVWRDLTLVWGGFFDGQVSDDHETYDLSDMWDPSVLEVHQDGVWRSVKTRGQIPPETCDAAAEVIGDGLFIACGNVEGEGVTNDIYRLDLNTWTWSELEPSGTRPLKSRNLASWVSGGRMFIFGGVGDGKLPSLWYPQYLKIQNGSFQDQHIRSNQEAVPIGKNLGEKVHFFGKQVYFLEINRIKCTYL